MRMRRWQRRKGKKKKKTTTTTNKKKKWRIRKKEGSRTDERRIRSIIWRKTTTEH